MRISIQSIPHDKQRYDTAGDWITSKDSADPLVPHFLVFVSQMQNPDHEFLLAIHELVEAYFCYKSGITSDMVDVFDFQFEADRKLGRHKADAEPGEHPDAPYKLQHALASVIERKIAAFLNIHWTEYCKALEAL